MTLRVLIVDDEPLARARLRSLLGDCRAPAAQVAGEAANAADAMAQLAHQRFDVALLDIHLPGADGMQLAQALRALAEPPAVVFVTAHTEYAVRAFEIEALDYLTKPVRLERLQAALQKAERLTQAERGPEADSTVESLLISERGRTLRVPLAEVLYLRAELKYVTVRTASASHLLDGSLSQLEERWGERFVRIHRNALVARAAMRALVRHVDADEGEGWAVQLAGVDEALAVSRRQLAAVRAALGQ
ncbi:MAG: response regulator transcription factor [Burkholderiaceae bacterium]|nr:response regulator transcription factor [Pseudomonadota bacterium]MBS0597407.1 response regulator transcription factor [Pseudomonadota bacterium]MCO5115726.1 LytTR family DNA-binding domain-containing protein [Burkholderiaceae bacterium]MCP5218589.1 response regulator transcription factor [Burkholderiaceae bacterium]